MSRISASTERIAVTLLQHQLDIAVRLLRNASECREGVGREEEVIKAAREAHRYSMDAAQKLPLSAEDLKRVEATDEDFKTALNRLVKSRHAS